MNMTFTPRVPDFSNHYWFVADDQNNVWSSARAMSVPASDADYVAWVESGLQTSQIGSMEELERWFAEHHPPGSLRTYCIYTRWRKESGGMTLTSGMPIKTDDRAKARISGTFAAAQANPAFTTQWHAADHTVHALDKAAIDAMSNELQAFIEDSFAVSADVLAQIEAGTITTREQIDAAFGIPPTHYRRRDPWDV
jgi:hypothetical protein